MSYRNSFSSLYGSGRASPYTSTLGQDGRSFSDLYEYVGPADIDPRGGYGRSSQTIVPEFQHSVGNHEAPDVIHVRYMANIFSVDFPAYSISESSATTGDLRRKVAHRLGQDHRRVRLVYKDTDLKKDRHSIKHYGCKQNSEVSVVLTEHFSEHSDHPSSEEEVAVGYGLQPVNTTERGRRPRGNSSVRYRSDEFGVTPDSNGLLHPLNGASHNRRRSPSRNGTRTRSRSPAPPTQPPAHAYAPTMASSTPSAPRSPPRPRADPNSPLGKVQLLEDEFYNKWYPQCHAYLDSPPSDFQTREKEWRRLTESIMRHVIEAADAIELQGNQEARAERKKTLNAAQELVKRLDAIGKPT